MNSMSNNAPSRNYLWIKVSLFYPMKNWNTLLNSGVRKFLHPEPKNYHLQFNNNDGENIRLAILVDSLEASDFTQKLQDFFNNFFSSYPQHTNPTLGNGIFKSCQSSSVYYGLYDNSKYFPLVDCNNLCNIIIKGVSDETIDLDLIFTLILYLQLLLVKSVSKISPELILCLFESSQVKTNENHDQNTFSLFKDKPTSSALKTAILKNKEIVLEIIEDVMAPKLGEYDQEWMSEWVTSCQIELQHLTQPGTSTSQTTRIIKKYYDYKVSIIYETLAISKETKSFLKSVIDPIIMSHFWRIK